MTHLDFLALLPLILISAGSVVVMLAVAVKRSQLAASSLSMLALVAAFLALWPVAAIAPHQVTSLLLVDRYAVFYGGLILASAAAVVAMSYRYFATHEGHAEEFYILLLTATGGCLTLVESTHFVSFFLGLEILSVSLYAMLAYLKDRRHSLEAGVKYLILAAVSSSFLLFGMALLYADSGTMEFARLGNFLANSTTRALDFTGLALILTGIGFKIGLVPFHLWIPDVYQGSPAPATAFLSTASKTAMVALLVRFFYLAHAARPMVLIFAVVAIASMLAGNLLALLQTNVKRILAYSSIAHFGYILVPFLASSSTAVEAVTFYLTAYSVTLLGAFAIVTGLSTAERDAERIDDFRGLFWSQPATAAAFTAMLFSLAGIPLTAGFFAKFYIVAAGASAGLWSLLIVLIVSSTIGLFYYLRVVIAMYSAPLASGAPSASIALAGGTVLAILAAILLWVGVYPAPLLDWIHRSPLAGI
jgi:NADH-quinone oxidoreductase subunit N